MRTLKTYLRRVMRDIRCKIEGSEALQTVFAERLFLAWRVLTQKKRQKEPKVYALHAPEVECIGRANVYGERQALTKRKAHRPYEFGVKVSFTTTIAPSKRRPVHRSREGAAWKPYDGHTLSTVLPAIEAMTGAALYCVVADAGYMGHDAPKTHRFRVYTQGQKRGVNQAIKRQFRRRAGIEPVIGHAKEDHRVGRNFLAYRAG